MARKNITIRELITEMIAERGLIPVMQFFNVTESTLNHWRRCAVLPRDEQKMKIIDASKGRITFKSMLEDYEKIKRGAQMELDFPKKKARV